MLWTDTSHCTHHAITVNVTPFKSEVCSGQERKCYQRSEGKHVQHSRANSTPAILKPSAAQASMQFSTVFSYWSTVTSWKDRALLSLESLLPSLRNAHITGPLPKKKAKRRCLLEASHGLPPAHSWNNGRIRWDLSTTIIKVKTFTAATVLTRIADTFFGTAIRGRRCTRCTESHDISTIWNPKCV
jgi:hypothetical protein